MHKGSIKLDDLDKQIIYELQRNGRVPFKKIARKLRVSDATVRFRTERMIQRRLLRINATVNPFFFENSIMAAVAMTLSKRSHRKLMQKVSKLSGVRSVTVLTGHYDLWVEVFFHSRQELRRFLEEDLSKFEEITSTQTFIFLETMNKWVEFSDNMVMEYQG